MADKNLSAIRSMIGRKGGRSPKTAPAGFKALSPEARSIISRMGVEARSKMSKTLRLDKRLCYLDECRAKPCPIRVKAFGKVHDFCCWTHILIWVGKQLEKVEEASQT